MSVQQRMTALDLLQNINRACCGLQSTERPGNASNSELRRWIQKGSFLVNGERLTSPDVKVPTSITQIVLHPKGRRITII